MCQEITCWFKTQVCITQVTTDILKDILLFQTLYILPALSYGPTSKSHHVLEEFDSLSGVQKQRQ